MINFEILKTKNFYNSKHFDDLINKIKTGEDCGIYKTEHNKTIFYIGSYLLNKCEFIQAGKIIQFMLILQRYYNVKFNVVEKLFIKQTCVYLQKIERIYGLKLIIQSNIKVL